MSTDPFEKLKLLQAFLKFLNLSRLLYLTWFLLICVAAISFWENRAFIYGQVRPGKITVDKIPVIVSPSTEAIIKSTVFNSTLISAIAVVSVNFEQNTRQLVYFLTDDLIFENSYKKFITDNLNKSVPLFNADPENNRRLIALINGEFVCSPFTATTTYRFAPDVDIQTVCSVGVPPYFGKFRGTVMVYLKTTPSSEELAQVRVTLRDLSNMLELKS